MRGKGKGQYSQGPGKGQTGFGPIKGNPGKGGGKANNNQMFQAFMAFMQSMGKGGNAKGAMQSQGKGEMQCYN